MANRRRFNQRVSRPQPRQMVWLGLNVIQTSVPSGAAVFLATYNAAALALRPFTIVRSRGIVALESDQIVADEEFGAIMSMQIVSEAAATAGVGSVPTPFVETDADYFVYEPWFGSYRNAVTEGADAQTQITFAFDSKAMRKVDIDDNLAFLAEGVGVQGSNITILGRQLVKLH